METQTRFEVIFTVCAQLCATPAAKSATCGSVDASQLRPQHGGTRAPNLAEKVNVTPCRVCGRALSLRRRPPRITAAAIKLQRDNS